LTNGDNRVNCWWAACECSLRGSIICRDLLEWLRSRASSATREIRGQRGDSLEQGDDGGACEFSSALVSVSWNRYPRGSGFVLMYGGIKVRETFRQNKVAREWPDPSRQTPVGPGARGARETPLAVLLFDKGGRELEAPPIWESLEGDPRLFNLTAFRAALTPAPMTQRNRCQPEWLRRLPRGVPLYGHDGRRTIMICCEPAVAAMTSGGG